MPERLDLTYTGEENEDHRPVMIHRALFGSYERFFMVLIEHFDGKFPLWLAPEQARVIPVSDDNLDYAETVAGTLDDDGFRVEVADGDRTVGRKIRAGHEDRVPYMLIVGDREEEAGTVSVRDRQERERDDVPLADLREGLRAERDEKRTAPDLLD
jgi:threonyl-tRNA synthetase